MNYRSGEQLFLIIVRLLANLGYGRMMQIISHEWYRQDPNGALVANRCYALLPKRQRAIYSKIAEEDELFRVALARPEEPRP